MINTTNTDEAINKYIEYIGQGEKTDYYNVKAVGEEAYQVMYSTRKKVVQKKRLDEILIGLGISQEVYELIKSGSRRRDLTIHKINYLKEAIRLNYTYKEAGLNISITESAVRSMVSRVK